MTRPVTVTIQDRVMTLERHDDEGFTTFRWPGNEIGSCPRCDVYLLEDGKEDIAQCPVIEIGPDERVIACECGWTSDVISTPKVAHESK